MLVCTATSWTASGLGWRTWLETTPGVLFLASWPSMRTPAELLAVPKAHCWPALLLVIFALLLHVGGYLVQQTRVSVVAFFLGLYGLMGLTWGLRWLRASFFPF